MQQPEEAMEYFISCSQTLISLYVYLKGNLIKLSCELLSSNVYIPILSWGPLCQQFWSQLRYWSVVCTGANFIYGLSKLCYVLHRCVSVTYAVFTLLFSNSHKIPLINWCLLWKILTRHSSTFSRIR